MKVVVDSNVLVAMIGKRSALRPLWDAFINAKYSIMVSEDILKEYEEILQIYAAKDADRLVMEIFAETQQVIYHSIYYKWNMVIEDPDDNKFFNVAVAANADYLVTNDAHFNRIKSIKFPKVSIINSDESLQIISKL